jgi:2-amino-4-hydroxy-6-hydroxymethyldihydropteridine diphosphokinase
MSTAFVALGSNSPDAAAQLIRAREALTQLAFCRFRRASAVYLTAPWGDLNQPDFLNAVIELDTELAPQALLAELQRIEAEQGRIRDPQRQLGPRTLDLDLLTCGGASMKTPNLTLPHPRMHLRAFVLVPLRDVAPYFAWPSLGKIDSMIDALATDVAGVNRCEIDGWNVEVKKQ